MRSFFYFALGPFFISHLDHFALYFKLLLIWGQHGPEKNKSRLELSEVAAIENGEFKRIPLFEEERVRGQTSPAALSSTANADSGSGLASSAVSNSVASLGPRRRAVVVDGGFDGASADRSESTLSHEAQLAKERKNKLKVVEVAKSVFCCLIYFSFS